MKETDYAYLYHMTDLTNIESILSKGLLSKNKVINERISIRDISDSNVQSLRMEKGLHSYVPLYFNPRNAMMYRVQNSSLLLIEVSKEVARIPGTKISKGNAARRSSEIYMYKESSLDNLNKSFIYARSWCSEDPMEKDFRKSMMQSEVLIPDTIPTNYFSKIITSPYILGDNERKLRKIAEKYGVKVETGSTKLFF